MLSRLFNKFGVIISSYSSNQNHLVNTSLLSLWGLISHVLLTETLFSFSLRTCHLVIQFKSYISELTLGYWKVVDTRDYTKRLRLDLAFRRCDGKLTKPGDIVRYWWVCGKETLDSKLYLNYETSFDEGFVDSTAGFYFGRREVHHMYIMLIHIVV